ncbi:M15 family metallopeptidase [Promicromonospora soli]|uniref:M15 family metallopeptidase n=1 Tax=Promicromonospora soli TaxID=2035533 RepID=UPI0016732D03|nr:M15 family metallopeptidase [Promicromonospora soli]
MSQDALAAPAASMGVTVSQVLAVLDRAERTLRQRDSSLSPSIAQAAAELGMLYTTYQAQQLALAQADEPLRVDTAPAAGKASTREVADAPVSAEQVSLLVTEKAERVSSVVPEQAQRGRAQPTQPQTQTQTQTIPASARTVFEARPSSRPHTEAQGPGYVTFDEVAVAAMRLANMLDPSSPTALIETLPDAGTSLRRNLLQTVAAYGSSTVGYANGRIPADVLCPLEFAPGHLLRCDAAERLTALSARFEREFGYPIPLTDSYRSYEMQIAVRDTKPHLAAIPGTSNHGWGLAIDLDDPIAGGSSPEYMWLRLHAPDYGWDNPSWAQLGGAKPEPWHFEFFAAGSIPNRAINPSDVGTWAPAGVANPAFLSTAAQRGAGSDPASGGSTGSDDGAPAATGSSSERRTEPEPEAPAPPPSEPAPSEPPTHGDPDDAPGDTSPADPGLVEDVLAGTVELVDGTVDGVVGSVVGGLLDSGGTQTDSTNRTATKTTDTD